MTTFTINTEDKKAEKVLKAFLNALELNYEIEKKDEIAPKARPFNKKEQQLYESLKNTFLDIKKWERGELEFKDAKTFLDEL